MTRMGDRAGSITIVSSNDAADWRGAMSNRHDRWLLTAAILALSTIAAGSSQSPEQAPPPPTSEALIDKALAAKQIDEETAHKYRVFAAFADPRLPARFKGVDTDSEEPPSLARVDRVFDTFSAQTKAELQPYFLRPDALGSWVERATAGEPPAMLEEDPPLAPGGESGPQTPIVWRKVPAVSGKILVWAQDRHVGDFQKAQDIAAAIDNRIWPKLVGLFWEPLGDDQRPMIGGGIAPVLGNHGPDGALDIYLVHPLNSLHNGMAPWVERGVYCGESPRYIWVNSRRPVGGPKSIGMVQTVAHELMHAIAHAKKWLEDNCEVEYNWINEATAKWVEDFVYADAQSEHRAAEHYLSDTKKPLNHEYDMLDLRHYGVYLLPFHLLNHGHQLAMPSMWQQFATEKSLAGIDAALRFEGTTLEKVFPQFAIENWNRGSIDQYRTADKMNTGASPPDTENPLVVKGPRDQPIPLEVPYLSSEYRYFKFEAGVKSVTFTNALRGNSSAEVWAVPQIKGQWKPPRDLTNETGATWCRDLPDEDLTELVLIFINKSWPKNPRQALTSLTVKAKPLLRTFGTGCTAWIGTSSVDLLMKSTWTLHETAETTVRFEPNPKLNTSGQPPEYWRAVSGTVKWTASASGPCSGSFSGTLPIGIDPDKFLAADLSIRDAGDPFTPPALRQLRYSGGVGPVPAKLEPAFVFACEGINLPTTLRFAATWWHPDPTGHRITEGTRLLNDQFSMPGLTPGTTYVWKWTFRAAP